MQSASTARISLRVFIRQTCCSGVSEYATVFAVYVNIYYRGEPAAVQAMASDSAVSVYKLRDGVTVFAPEEPSAGFIFYPGGKVEYTAYAPLLRACAERGVLCVLIRMPCNLAVFNINGANGIPDQFPDADHWYLGGHSLGGAMKIVRLNPY